MKIVIGLSLCTLILVAPVRAQSLVEPRARQIFDKAAHIYESATTMQLRWQEKARLQIDEATDEETAARGMVTFDRKGLMRWQSTEESSRYSVVVVDKKNIFRLLSEGWNLSERPVYGREPLGQKRSLAAAYEQLTEQGDWYPILSEWLQGTSLLEPQTLARLTQNADIVRYSAKVLPSANLSKQLCDVVRLNITYRDKTFLQETYWFQKSSGLLLRLQRRSEFRGDDDNDIRILSQQFNLPLGPTTFLFVPPKNATLESVD